MTMSTPPAVKPSGERGRLAATLRRGAGGAVLVMAAGTVAALGANLLLTRLMGVAEYGVYIYAFTWLNLLVLVCSLGLETSLLRFVPEYNAKEDWAHLRGLLATSQRYVLTASGLAAALGAAVVWGLRPRLSASEATTFWITLLLIPVVTLTALRGSTLRSYKHIVRAGLPAQVVRPLLMAAAAGTFYLLGGRGLTAPIAMWLALIAAAVALLLATAWQASILPAAVRQTPAKREDGLWLRVSLPLLFMAGMHMVLSQADILMLGAIENTADAGVYAVASRVARFVSLGLVSANAIVAPMISELFSTGRRDALQHLLAMAARGIFAFTVVVGGLFVLFGAQVLAVFGPGFSAGYVPLVILIAGQAVSALSGSVGFLMALTGHHVRAAQIVGASAVLNVALNGVLISSMGMKGAAIATSATMAISNLVMLAHVWQTLRLNPTILSRG